MFLLDISRFIYWVWCHTSWTFISWFFFLLLDFYFIGILFRFL